MCEYIGACDRLLFCRHTRPGSRSKTLSAGAGVCRTGARPAQVAFSNYPLERTRAAPPPSVSSRPGSLAPAHELALLFRDSLIPNSRHSRAVPLSGHAPENTRFRRVEACLLSRAGTAQQRSRERRSRRTPWQPARNHQRPRSWCPPSAARGRQESAAR
jgi:hypothetical protein